MQPSKWMEAVQVACARHRRPTKQECYDIAWELFPGEMEADQDRKARRGHMAELAAVMRTAGNIEEQADGPQVQLALPGLQAPAYLTVPDPDGGLTLVEYAKSMRPERRAAIDMRHLVIGRIQARVRDLEGKERYLDGLAPNDHTTVEDALRLATRQSAAPRPRRPKPAPHQPGAPA